MPRITTFLELPGALFLGTPSNEDLEVARHMQTVRADYEATDCQATLWADLTQLFFGYDEIAAAILNPASLTRALYGWRPGMSLAWLKAA